MIGLITALAPIAFKFLLNEGVSGFFKEDKRGELVKQLKEAYSKKAEADKRTAKTEEEKNYYKAKAETEKKRREESGDDVLKRKDYSGT